MMADSLIKITYVAVVAKAAAIVVAEFGNETMVSTHLAGMLDWTMTFVGVGVYMWLVLAITWYVEAYVSHVPVYPLIPVQVVAIYGLVALLGVALIILAVECLGWL